MSGQPAPIPMIGAAELRRLVPLAAAMAALERAFTADPPPRTVPRSTVPVAEGSELLLMPATAENGVGVKLLSVAAANPGRGLPLIQGVYVLFSPDALQPVAVLDGAALTALRTPAVSAIVTDRLALPSAEHLVIFGSGTQARGHLAAMRAIRPIARLTVVARDQQRGQRFVDEVRRAHRLDATLGTPAAVADADIVCTCTTSAEPLFDGALLRPGSHVNAVGSYKPDARELDDRAVQRARIVVELRAEALAKAGDLAIPIARGLITPQHAIAEIRELLLGAPVRRSPRDVTVFKSVGVAVEDLAVAAVAFEAAACGAMRAAGEEAGVDVRN